MLGRLVAEAARRFGDTPAFVSARDPDRAISYARLDRLSDEVAVGLQRRGVRAGDRIALVMAPAVEYPVLYIAAAKLGAVTAGLNARIPRRQQRALLDLIEPRLLISDGSADLPGDAVELITSAGALLAPLRVPGEAPGLLPEDPDRPVAIVFTSGTTGVPKAAVFADRQLAAVTEIDVGGSWGGGGRGLAATSFAHLGPMTKLPGSLRRSSTTYVTRQWRPGEALDLIGRFGISSIGGIPTQIALMLSDPGLPEADLSTVRTVVIGGAPATAALVRSARAAFGAPVCVRYSCTEAGVGCGTAPDDPPGDAEHTVGRPLPGVQLAIRDGEGRAVATGERGEVLLRSPAAMSGYFGDRDATAAAFTDDGFVRTGDIGWVDERGRLHLAGRTREMYIRGGYNVYPVEVEAALSTCPGVRDITVVPQDDEVMGEIGIAVVVPAGRAPLSLERLRAHGAQTLPWYALPERIFLVDALPLTAGEKVDRQALRTLVASASTLTGVSSTPESPA